MQNYQTVFSQLSIYGLTTVLHKRVMNKTKRTISRNTVHLSFKEPTTDLRRYIVRAGEELLKEFEDFGTIPEFETQAVA